MSTESTFDPKEYKRTYERQYVKQFKLALNRNTESDIIQHLEQQPNIRQYLLSLIRQDMDRRD